MNYEILKLITDVCIFFVVISLFPLILKKIVAQIKPAVRGATGIHIILPSYYAPNSIGLVDMQTSDGRFMFLLPWQVQTIPLLLILEFIILVICTGPCPCGYN